MGKIRTPFYRIVVADSRTKRDGRVIEEIGTYNPKTEPSTITVVSERAQYWLGVGAQPSEAVLALLKLTGDWEKHSGEKSDKTLLSPAPKPDKAEAFNAALAELHAEPKVGATTTKKAAAKKAEKPADKAEKAEKPAEAPAAEAVADEKPAEAVADEKPAEDAPVAEAAAESTDEAKA